MLFLFFFNATATPEIYTLSLHDALPIFRRRLRRGDAQQPGQPAVFAGNGAVERVRLFFHALRRREQAKTDRKSTRLNSSHRCISYAVFCLKKKKIMMKPQITRK